MRLRRDAYTTKELTVRTWPDFVSLFSKGNGWDFCWCMHFQRPRTLPKGQRRRTRAERGVRNRRQKKELVEQGLAHGILVYAKGEPVGWCQYGPREELSRIDNKRNYRCSAGGSSLIDQNEGWGCGRGLSHDSLGGTLPSTRAPMRAYSGVWQCIHARNVIHVRKAGDLRWWDRMG